MPGHSYRFDVRDIEPADADADGGSAAPRILAADVVQRRHTAAPFTYATVTCLLPLLLRPVASLLRYRRAVAALTPNWWKNTVVPNFCQ